MNIIERLYEMRDEDLSYLSSKDKEELLKLYPKYCEDSKLEILVSENSELKKSFDEFCLKMSTETAFFNKKFYLTGLSDGINIMKFAKGAEYNDC